MLYRNVPKNGDKLSILGFGCMRLPLKDGRLDQERAIRQIRHAVDQGVNYLDTAWPYHEGESERVLGKALRDGYRDRVKVATKLPSFLVDKPDDMDRYLDAQLEKLETSSIDYYLMHTLNAPLWDKMKDLGAPDFLDRAIADGRIKNAGFSFHGLSEDFPRIVDEYPWSFCQIQYNFLDQDYQAGTAGLRYAAARDLAVIVMEPMRGGTLGLAEQPPAVAALWNEAKASRPPVEWALLWLWNQPEVTVVLSGMNEESHIEENLAIADKGFPGVLDEEEVRLVDRVAGTYRDLMKVGCTGCGYCLPCPSNVMIPGCFELYNTLHMYQSEAARFSYAVRMCGDLSGAGPGFASQCVECGECLEKCPQEIQIPEVLAEVVADMEGTDLEERVAMARKMLMKRVDGQYKERP